MKIIQTFKTCYQYDFEYIEYECFTDDDLINHLNIYCENFDNICESIYSFPKKIHQLDIWRYIYIYMYGGLYVDIDINIKNNIINYISIFENNDVVLFKESPVLSDGVFLYVLYCFKFFFKLNDHPRFYQYRQSIFYTKQFNPNLRFLINRIILNFETNKYENLREPYYTFELTGPGIFTDVMKDSNHFTIQYEFSKELIDYHSTGSWRNEFEPFIKTILFMEYILIVCMLIKIYVFIKLRLSKKNIILL